MKKSVALDLTELPPHGLGTASVSWWGTLAFMLIEGTGFALSIVVYLYLMSMAQHWPLDAPPPDLLAGTTLTALLVRSEEHTSELQSCGHLVCRLLLEKKKSIS